MSDCIVLMGGNMAEAHPVGFQWVTEAKARGARVIHVDPRFTRTSAVADRHIAIRVGSDVVLLGGLINYVLTHDRWFKEYVVAYTNAATLVSPEFRDTEDLGGLFSGFDPRTGKYDPSTWAYDTEDGDGPSTSGPTSADDPEHHTGEPMEGTGPAPTAGHSPRDETLQHPRTVFQVLKRHFSRYTPEMVEQMCGISVAEFEYLATSIADNSGRERTTCFGYATGWTQHTLGAQFIRTAAILQLLLGNVGRPGSGIMALRGHASIQGSTDIPTLFNLLPGYLPMPRWAGTTPSATTSTRSRRKPAEGLLGLHRGLHDQPAEGVVGRCRPGRQRLGLRLSAAAVRPARHLPDRDRDARRQRRGLLHSRPESGRRVRQRPPAAARDGPSEVARGA